MTYEQQREQMVASQIAARGVRAPEVLAAFRAVPRHLFVPVPERAVAYSDRPLSIGFGQTISQPYIVALMTAELALSPRVTVLEVGAGSGYQTAILAEVGCRVVALELLQPLADRARLTLASLGYEGVVVHCRDGRLGASDLAPPGGYDRILVAAATPTVPPALLEQLAVGGRLIIPLGEVFGHQELYVFERHAGGFDRHAVLPVRFVPLVAG